jgi:hypothetical protein
MLLAGNKGGRSLAIFRGFLGVPDFFGNSRFLFGQVLFARRSPVKLESVGGVPRARRSQSLPTCFKYDTVTDPGRVLS